MTTCAIYIRKSREEKDKPSHRLTVQREQLPSYALSQGWGVQTYDDGHASAARGKAELLLERSRMEADIRAGKINIILCIELSRLSRDDTMQDYVSWLTLCADHHVRLATMSRCLDPAQHSDWMLLLMEGGFSSVEMKVLQGRMREGRQGAFRAGKFLGGVCPPPYIYDKAAGKPVVDDAALKRMQQIWEMAESHGTRHIAEVMNMPLIAIRRIISDERLLFYQAQRIDAASVDLIPCDWQPVMTADQAQRIKQRRVDRISGYSRRQSGGLLSNLGILTCGYCGRSCRSWTNSRDQAKIWYGCKANEHSRACAPSRLTQQRHIDQAVITNLFNTINDVGQLQKYWEDAESANDTSGQTKEIAARIKDLSSRKQRLIQAISEGVIEFADARETRTLIETEIVALEKQRQTILDGNQNMPDWQALGLTQTQFDSLDQSDQREFIHLCIAEIRLYSSYATIKYRFPRNSSGNSSTRIHLPPPDRPGAKKRQ